MNFKTEVIVIGAGHAGLATSYFLHNEGINHIVLERDRIGSSWSSQRWDSFKMNTPNWMNCLPGMQSPELLKDLFMNKDEFTSYLNDYVNTFQLPVNEFCKVVRIKLEDEHYIVTIDNRNVKSQWSTKAVVIASGIRNCSRFPELARHIPQNILQLHASEYKNSNQLPAGNILVVGGGQSGCQIAEDLAVSGRKVYLASSKVTRIPRRYKGKDVMEWMDLLGANDIRTSQMQENTQFASAEAQNSGVGFLGHTLSYQSLHKLGVTVLGSLNNFKNGIFNFANNAKEHVRYADETSAEVKKSIDNYIKTLPNRIPTVYVENDSADIPDDDFISVSERNIIYLDLHEINSIIWATGFTHDFSYLPCAWTTQEGTPKHFGGKIDEGLYCLGFPAVRKQKSGLVYGIREDAEVIVKELCTRLRKTNNRI